MANKKHDITIAALQATIRTLESTVARLQLTPAARPSPFSRPARVLPSWSYPPPIPNAFVVMGPVEIMEYIPPLQVLRIYMDARLPGFALPEPGRIKVILDPTQANHLRIFMSTADVRALRNACYLRLPSGPH
ncbi:hypothetical protein B0H19DRAFT_1382916 [Mycena capillaripes]|nr:hypothetical protein B0H19DRAFT_1382916 [Mycena capillaripes]